MTLALAASCALALAVHAEGPTLLERIGAIEGSLSSTRARYDSLHQRSEAMAAQWLGGHAKGAAPTMGPVGPRGAPGTGMHSYDAGEAMICENRDGRTVLYAGTGSAGAGMSVCHDHDGDATTYLGSSADGDGMMKLTYEDGSLHTLIDTDGTTHFNSKGKGVAFVGSSSSGNGRLVLANKKGVDLITINAPSSGAQIWAAGGDVAEVFEFRDETRVDAGTLVCIDPTRPGQLAVCEQHGSTLVAGVVSSEHGDDGLTPALILGRRDDGSADRPVAVAGRVHVKADTSRGAIRPGDLLVASATPGQVCRLDDTTSAVGATVGKAVEPLDGDDGVIQMLVMLR